MRHTVPIVDSMHNIRHVLTLNVLKTNVKTAVTTPTVFLLLDMACFTEIQMLATWNLALIMIDRYAKGVITILSTAQFVAVPIARLADFAGTRTRHHAIVAQGGVFINASPRSVPNVTLYYARIVSNKG